MKLTQKFCKNVEPKERPFKRFDGGGLYLEVMPNGRKHWRLKYHYMSKEKRLALGEFPYVTLSQAREKRHEYKALLARDIDPSAHRLEKKMKEQRENNISFESVAKEWHEIKSVEWSASHAEIVLLRLENNIFPFLGTWPITKIGIADLLEVLRKIENRGALEVAKRTRQICSQVFQFAIQTDRANKNPAVELKGALKTATPKHFAALDITELPNFLLNLQRNETRLFPRTRRAIEFSMLTFARPGEIRQARWKDIDMYSSRWVIPATFMKSKKDHIVPLALRAEQILILQQKETGHIETPWVFPSQRRPSRPMSEGTVNVAIKRMGYGGRMTAHGFRALARTTIREKLGYFPDVIEAQLAHKPSGPLGAAYDRAQFLQDRKKMMQDWADYISNIGQAEE